MADPIDTAPTTSYSDPIYDRLESLGNRISRAKWILVVALLAAVALGLGLRAMTQHRPGASSAIAFVNARSEQDPEKREKDYAISVADTSSTPFFRASAALELAQIQLGKGKPADAKTWVDQAAPLATQAGDDQLQLVVRLAQASVAEDSGELDVAIGHYAAVEQSGMIKYPTHGLLGALGAARVEMVQGNFNQAVERLEPQIERSEPEYDQILSVIRLLYWQAKRSAENTASAPAAVVVEEVVDVVVEPEAPAADAAPEAAPDAE